MASDTPSSSLKSNGLIHKRANDSLVSLSPPPAKKIKRPRKVLDEDSYTDALSHIIARDFFPGLLETETKQEYLDALESNDQAWISSASRRLRQVMSQGARHTATSSSSKFEAAFQTPKNYHGDTPLPQNTPTLQSRRPLVADASMSLSGFQAKYTSDDNESFYRLVDKQNQKKAEKYAWLWRGNKLPSKQMIKQQEVERRLAQTRSLIDDGYKRDRLAIRDAEERPAQPDTWKSNPKNTLMFGADGVRDDLETTAQRAAEASRMGPKAILHHNTRMPQPHIPHRPPSPTMSAVRDAIAGRTRSQDQDSSVFVGGETPRVNGYAFVDEEDYDDHRPTSSETDIDLGPGDTTNPFKVQQQRKRESLHERMVDRIARSKKESARSGVTGKVERTPVPKFPSSPKVTGGLTPAAQRLWSKVGTPGGRNTLGTFGQVTPKTSRGSLLKSVSRPGRRDQ